MSIWLSWYCFFKFVSKGLFIFVLSLIMNFVLSLSGKFTSPKILKELHKVFIKSWNFVILSPKFLSVLSSASFVLKSLHHYNLLMERFFFAVQNSIFKILSAFSGKCLSIASVYPYTCSVFVRGKTGMLLPYVLMLISLNQWAKNYLLVSV